MCSKKATLRFLWCTSKSDLNGGTARRLLKLARTVLLSLSPIATEQPAQSTAAASPGRSDVQTSEQELCLIFSRILRLAVWRIPLKHDKTGCLSTASAQCWSASRLAGACLARTPSSESSFM